MLSLWTPWPDTAGVVVLAVLWGATWVCALAALGWSHVRQWEISDAQTSALPMRSNQWWLGLGALLGTGLALLGYVSFGPTPALFAALVFGAALVVLAGIDARTGYLPDLLTQPLLWLGLLVNLEVGFVPLPQAVLGAVAGYGFFWCVAWLFARVTGRQGLGHGDFKLLAALGAWLGVAALPSVLLVASASGLLMACIGRLRGKLLPRQSISFGPYLALAGLWSLFGGGVW